MSTLRRCRVVVRGSRPGFPGARSLWYSRSQGRLLPAERPVCVRVTADLPKGRLHAPSSPLLVLQPRASRLPVTPRTIEGYAGDVDIVADGERGQIGSFTDTFDLEVGDRPPTDPVR